MKWVLFCLLLTVPFALAAGLEVEETETEIRLLDGENVALTYHKTEVTPPPEADPLYRRSGFIHPLRTPAGIPVTGIYPDDHYHHLGLWHAWVKTKWKGRAIDFWNLKKGEGRVRYTATESLMRGGQSVGFTVRQEHVATLDGDGEETVILIELLTVEMHRESSAYVINYRILQENVTSHDLELPAHRYGGALAYRGPHHWNNDTSNILTSAGKTRKDGHETRAKWVRYGGRSEDGSAEASVAFISSPRNHDSPQRVRIWPPDTHDGATFFNFAPTQESAWVIPADDVIEHHYRLIVADGTIEEQTLDHHWKALSGE